MVLRSDQAMCLQCNLLRVYVNRVEGLGGSCIGVSGAIYDVQQYWFYFQIACCERQLYVLIVRGRLVMVM